MQHPPVWPSKNVCCIYPTPTKRLYYLIHVILHSLERERYIVWKLWFYSYHEHWEWRHVTTKLTHLLIRAAHPTGFRTTQRPRRCQRLEASSQRLGTRAEVTSVWKRFAGLRKRRQTSSNWKMTGTFGPRKLSCLGQEGESSGRYDIGEHGGAGKSPPRLAAGRSPALLDSGFEQTFHQ